MSDFSLLDIVNLVRQEINKTQIGNVKKITGPAGEKGATGEPGGPGIQGPRGDKGPSGPVGPQGNQGKKGDKGVKGDDGTDGVGVARIEQDLDDSIIMHMTDGNSYVIEMPILDKQGNPTEVHYKAAGGGGGVVDLSKYVRRPTNTHDGKWLVYREPDGSNQGEWSPATTDLIETNGQLMFRDSKGRFAPTPEELDELTNQLKVNRFLWDKIQALDTDGKDNSVFEKHLFQLRGGFTLTDDRKVVVPIENPKGTQKGTRDFYDDLEYADYPGVFHLSKYDQYSLDEDQYTPELVEYFLFHGTGAFKENDGQGGWETAAHRNVKPNIAVGDIVTVRVTEGWRNARDEGDKYSTGYLGKVQHRWRVTEIIPCVEEDGSTPLNDGEWQCVKVEKCEREDLYAHAEVRYNDRTVGLCDVTVWEPTERGSDSELNKDWMMQLRGNFEFDGDGKAIMPPKSYSNTEDNPVLNPETGLYESGWQKPGVYWHGAEPYEPSSITHLLISKAVGFVAEGREGDGAYIGYEEFFFQDWQVGDLIEVKAHEYGLWEADYYGKLLQKKSGGFHNNTWRVVEEVVVVNPNDDWSNYAYSCFRVEKVAPPQFYQGSVEVYEDASDDGVSIAGFFPCEVTMNPAATHEDLLKLQSEIVELEEEIDAIAPSVERGIWKFNLGGVVGNRGQLTMYDGMNGTGSPIGLFTNVKSVWLNELDNDGTPHGFGNVSVGDLIELFVQGESDYGLFTVVEVHDESEGASQYWMIDVDFVRSLSATSKADNADDIRVKIIQPPSAEGETDGRYILNGDETTLKSVTTILPGQYAYINFQAATSGTGGFLVMRDSNNRNVMHVHNSGMVKLKEGRMAEHEDEITTKRYVDSKVVSSGATFPGRRFKMAGYGQGTGVSLGYFSPDSSTGTTENLYISVRDQDGLQIAETSPDFTPGVTMPITIYRLSSGIWKSIGFAIYGGTETDYQNNYIKMRMVTWKQKPELSVNVVYAIVVGGKW